MGGIWFRFCVRGLGRVCVPGLTLVSQPFSCGQCTAVEARNRVPFKGILRFLDHYPCGDGRKKLHSERGAWGLVAVQGSLPASGDPGDTGHSAGAAPVTRGRKSIPCTSLSSLRDQDGFSVPIQVCVNLPRERSRRTSRQRLMDGLCCSMEDLEELCWP